MPQPLATRGSIDSVITPFNHRLDSALTKKPVTILQVNLGKRCNLACSHCHVDASPHRTEEMSSAVVDRVIETIYTFPQLKTVDLTGGAPEMLNGFKPILEAAVATGKQVIVRSNLTIYFVPGYDDIPEYCAQNRVRIVASLPCYLADNVDKMRGQGVFDDSIKALQWLNRLGYGRDPSLQIDLVYNPPIPTSTDFRLTPDQVALERDYKKFLLEHFDVCFNSLFTITNLPIGRTKFQLEHHQLHQPYLQFLESNYNSTTVPQLMCRDQLSIDYLGSVYDCDFNQMANLPATTPTGEILTIDKLLAAGTLDLIGEIQTETYCYGCTAGCGSSCGGALIS
ncbi:arsenosugar biosynthesis radical SAM (seleno)protein ArsS [Chamaesiphon sp. VAR_48_metabat_135_sub]|uniref:arsenosugar biosynthesis radical SAM (seleno)protein ArsS n=1 Tax=Chamaesiphon sp. VAR_48_metabat_135_sub TaxID=2964699 RepID=UPI00286A74B4|nr:arsenosugar biosynthesis radical SAM (seleno)protein ArsS [Chamaesiphon sp. VAR_48_metabat_135_sub]